MGPALIDASPDRWCLPFKGAGTGAGTTFPQSNTCPSIGTPDLHQIATGDAIGRAFNHPVGYGILKHQFLRIPNVSTAPPMVNSVRIFAAPLVTKSA
jgi:hypothetical protein